MKLGIMDFFKEKPKLGDKDKEKFFEKIFLSNLSGDFLTDFDSIFEIIDEFDGEIEVEDLKFFMKKYKLRKEDLKTISIAKMIPKTAENIKKLQEIGINPKHFLFQVDSLGKTAFDEIFERTLENNSDIYTEMRNIVKEFIEKNNLQKNIFSEKDSNFFAEKYNYISKKENLDLSIYIRYGHQIDFPEIAELIAIFCDEMGKNRGFRYFDKIRILPRFPNKHTPKNLVKNLEFADFFQVKGKDFEEKLTKNAVSVYLSHSSEPKTNIPNIISNSMHGNGESVKSEMELEEGLARNTDFGKEYLKSLKSEQVLEIFLKNIQKIENKLRIKIEQEKLKDKMENILSERA